MASTFQVQFLSAEDKPINLRTALGIMHRCVIIEGAVRFMGLWRKVTFGAPTNSDLIGQVRISIKLDHFHYTILFEVVPYLPYPHLASLGTQFLIGGGVRICLFRRSLTPRDSHELPLAGDSPVPEHNRCQNGCRCHYVISPPLDAHLHQSDFAAF